MSQHSEERRTTQPFYSQVDVGPAHNLEESDATPDREHENTVLLRDILSAQDRTNELLEELVSVMAATQKQRAAELNQWRKANPRLTQACRRAAESLSQVQVEYLSRMTEEVSDTVDDLVEGEFMLSEFVDRYGPRLAHLNGIIQVLAQLSGGSGSNEQP